MVKILKVFSLLLKIFVVVVILAFLTPFSVKAEAILFSDDFSDNIADGWTSNSYLYVNSGKYGGKVSPPFTVADSVTGLSSWSNYSYEIDMQPIQGEDKNLLFGYKDSTHRYGFHISGGALKIEKVFPSTVGHEDVVSAPISFINGESYRVKLP